MVGVYLFCILQALSKEKFTNILRDYKIVKSKGNGHSQPELNDRGCEFNDSSQHCRRDMCWTFYCLLNYWPSYFDFNLWKYDEKAIPFSSAKIYYPKKCQLPLTKNIFDWVELSISLRAFFFVLVNFYCLSIDSVATVDSMVRGLSWENVDCGVNEVTIYLSFLFRLVEICPSEHFECDLTASILHVSSSNNSDFFVVICCDKIISISKLLIRRRCCRRCCRHRAAQFTAYFTADLRNSFFFQLCQFCFLFFSVDFIFSHFVGLAKLFGV